MARKTIILGARVDPETAQKFNELCNEWKVKKSAVLEALIRGLVWLLETRERLECSIDYHWRKFDRRSLRRKKSKGVEEDGI